VTGVQTVLFRSCYTGAAIPGKVDGRLVKSREHHRVRNEFLLQPKGVKK
jgi:hypothetical protein